MKHPTYCLGCNTLINKRKIKTKYCSKCITKYFIQGLATISAVAIITTLTQLGDKIKKDGVPKLK